MTVKELIGKLKKMPQDVQVILWADVDAEIELRHIQESELVEECVAIVGK